MRIILINIVLFILASPIYAQSLADTIQIKRVYSTSFYQNNRKLSPKALLNITASNPEAYKAMKYAKGQSDAAGIFSFIGSFFIGWPIGTALGGGDPEWSLAYIGGLFVLASIPPASNYKKRAIKAIHIYNDGLKEIGYNDIELQLNFTNNGIGCKMTF